VPELPDLAILADALDAALAGRPIESATVSQSLVLRGTSGELDALRGQKLTSLSRRGKFLLMELSRDDEHQSGDRIIWNPMLTGRLGLAAPGGRPFAQTAAVLRFGARATDWPVVRTGWPADTDWLPPADGPVELRYRDATRMGKIYVLPVGVERAVAGWQEQGPEADSAELTVEAWRDRISRHGGELKSLLRNQQFVAGIGNAYSDEILWAARLAPYRARSSLTADEVDGLYRATREVLAWAIEELRRLVPPRLEVEQRRFLRVHGKGGEACPRCGSTISEVKAGGAVTNWCRTCQK